MNIKRWLILSISLNVFFCIYCVIMHIQYDIGLAKQIREAQLEIESGAGLADNKLLLEKSEIFLQDISERWDIDTISSYFPRSNKARLEELLSYYTKLGQYVQCNDYKRIIAPDNTSRCTMVLSTRFEFAEAVVKISFERDNSGWAITDIWINAG